MRQKGKTENAKIEKTISQFIKDNPNLKNHS